MTRSTDECDISRSCHSAMFSKRRLSVRPDHARQPANLLAGDGVALVRHGGGALLARGERLLRFPHLRALEVANFERDLLHRGRDDRERRKELRVAVALDHLGRDRRGLQARAVAQTRSSTSGPRWANVPTAPEIFP